MAGPSKRVSFFAFMVLLGGTVCHASTIAYSFSTNGTATSVGAGDFTLGFQFTTLTDVLVDSLGLMDVGQDGLAGTEKVGIWNSSGTLLYSTTLGTGTLEGPVLSGSQFSFTSIAPLFLAGGHTYTIGAQLDGVDSLIYYDANNAHQTSGAPSLLTVSSSSYNNSTLSFGKPDTPAVFRYDVVNFTVEAAAPEPGSGVLAIGALAGALLLLRYRRRPVALADHAIASRQ